MTYNINKTDGTALITPTMPNGQLLDGTSDTATGLTLIGRNYTGYGQVQNENFISLLQNFAKDTPPTQNQATVPLIGTLWYDTSTSLLKIYNGTSFVLVSGQTASATAPTALHTGDQWWDTVNNQLRSWNGNTWVLIGPGYTTAQGKSGAVVETVYDTLGNAHTVVNTYTNGNLISITSYDSAFTPNVAVYNFPGTVAPGITISNTNVLTGTATNSQHVGGLSPTVFARQDINQTFAGDVGVTGNLVFTNANIHYVNNALALHNHTLSGNVDLWVNVPIIGNQKSLWVDGAAGLAYVANDPVNSKGIATKGYVDTAVVAGAGSVTALQALLESEIVTLRNDTDANLAAATNSTNANLITVQSGINSNVSLLAANTAANMSAISSTFNTVSNDLNILQSEIVSLAPINSPQFTGAPIVPQTPALNTFLSSVPATQKPYLLQLTAPITVYVNDVITQLDANTLVPVATLTVHANVTNSNVVPVTIVSGVITVGTQTFNSDIQINGVTVVPAVGIPSIQYLGPQLDYLGLGDNSANVASTSYVDVTANVLYRDYNSKINTLATVTATNLATAVAPLATIASPQFTGAPTAPTPPLGDFSGNIATTGFVTAAITAQKFNYTVSTNPPTGGKDGDFWFVVG